MNPELKAYLDEWQAANKCIFDKLVNAFLPPATELGAAEHDNSTLVVGPVQASSGTSELVTASARLAEPPAPAPSIVASPLVALAAPIDTVAVVPASCLTKCAAQAVPASTTTTLLPWVSASSSSPATSANNGVVSTELASDNDPDEHGVSPASSSLSSSPTRFTAWKNASPTAPTPREVSDTQLLWPFPVQVLSPLAPVKHSTECMDDDTHALMLPSVRGAAENFSIPILDTGQVVLCTSSLPCVENIEVEALSMCDIIPDDTGANQRPPWPPPDLKVLCSNGIHSSQLTNPILEAHSSSYAPSFLKIYSVNEENQKTPCLCEVIPGAITCGPDYFRWEIACVLVVSPSARTNIGNASDLADAPSATAPDAYTKAWAHPKDPSDLESYLKAHYCHDCEGLPVCTHNIFVCWESDIVPPPYPYMSRCDNSKSRPIPWPSFADLSGCVHITEPRPPLQGTWGEFLSVVELHCFSYGLFGISPLPMCLQYEQQPCFPWSRPIESVCKLSGKIIQAGLGPPEEYLFVWLQPKPPWSYILIKIDAEVEERGVHLRVAEITSVQLILFKLLLPVGICLYELPLPGYSLYSSSFGSASEELFRESKKLEFNNWVSYMLEQYNYISTCGINTELQSLCECTNRPLMQAVGIPDSNKQMQLCMAARGLFILQNQGHRWMSHEFAPLCYCYTTLLAAQGADTDGIVTRKQYRVLVPRTEVPWDPDGSTWCRWFSTSTEHGPFQGGRNAIFVTKFFEQVFAGNKHYIDFNQVHASDNYYLGTSFVWVPASHENCSYLIQIYPNFVYCSDSNQIKDRRLQWDPGGFSVMSAWGQAEFQGGRDVRNLTWVQHVGLPSWASKDGLGPANPPRRTAATYTLQEVTNRISRLDQDETAAALLSHLRL